jgi:hypothetical protein
VYGQETRLARHACRKALARYIDLLDMQVGRGEQIDQGQHRGDKQRQAKDPPAAQQFEGCLTRAGPHRRATAGAPGAGAFGALAGQAAAAP